MNLSFDGLEQAELRYLLERVVEWRDEHLCREAIGDVFQEMAGGISDELAGRERAERLERIELTRLYTGNPRPTGGWVADERKNLDNREV